VDGCVIVEVDGVAGVLVDFDGDAFAGRLGVTDVAEAAAQVETAEQRIPRRRIVGGARQAAQGGREHGLDAGLVDLVGIPPVRAVFAATPGTGGRVVTPHHAARIDSAGDADGRVGGDRGGAGSRGNVDSDHNGTDESCHGANGGQHKPVLPEKSPGVTEGGDHT